MEQHLLDYDYVRDFVAGKVIPCCNELSIKDRFSIHERRLIIAVSNALSMLPYIDQQTEIFLEIDFYWENKNWVGRLSFKEGVFELWSSLCEKQGTPSELCAQWQRTAVRISFQHGVENYDQGHMWFWADCFRQFVHATNEKGASPSSSLSLVTPTGSLIFPNSDEEEMSS